jgi:hypothetical protein
VKSALLVAAVLALGLMFFFYRRRLRLAVLVAGGLYAVVTVVRLFFLREDLDRLTTLVLALGSVAALWLAVNLVVSLIVQRRRTRGGR